MSAGSKCAAFAFVVLGMSALYALVLRFTGISLREQFALDALLVTWLVWVTGNLYSPYTALYILIISAASIFLRALHGRIVESIRSGVITTDLERCVYTVNRKGLFEAADKGTIFLDEISEMSPTM